MRSQILHLLECQSHLITPVADLLLAEKERTTTQAAKLLMNKHFRVPRCANAQMIMVHEHDSH